MVLLRSSHRRLFTQVGSVASVGGSPIGTGARSGRPGGVWKRLGPTTGLGPLRVHYILLRLHRHVVLVGRDVRGAWLRVQRRSPRGGADTEASSQGAPLRGPLYPVGCVGKKTQESVSTAAVRTLMPVGAMNRRVAPQLFRAPNLLSCLGTQFVRISQVNPRQGATLLFFRKTRNGPQVLGR